MKDFQIDENSIPPCLEYGENIVLWRYMSFASLCEILMYNHIPLIKSDLFEDKSEGIILKEILNKISGTYPYSIDYAMKVFRQSTFISSWCASEHEDAAMWDKYASGNSGVAIKTNSDRLITCIDDSEYDNSTRIIKRVQYTDKIPSEFIMDELLLDELFVICFFYKMIDFQYENEVRIAISLFGNPHSFAKEHPSVIPHIRKNTEDLFKTNPMLKNSYMNKKTHDIVITSSADLIEEIVISPYSHKNFIHIVNQILRYIGVEDRIRISESRRKQWV